MNISRRLALGCASAFAVAGGTAQSSLASVVKRAVTAPASGSLKNLQAAQRFVEQLIHHDEAGHAPYTTVIWLTAPDTAWDERSSLEESQYRVMNHNYKKHGYRLRRLSAFQTNEGVRYAALWELATGPAWESTHNMPLAKFETARNDFKQSGYRMTHIDARVNYAAIWERGDSTTEQVFSALTLLEYEQQYSILTSQGFRPHRISTTAVAGEPSFAVIFEKASTAAWQSKYQMSSLEFHNADNAAKAQGFRLTDASGYMLSGKPKFSGIWEKPVAA